MGEYEFVDHLKEYVTFKVKEYVENIKEYYPAELVELKKTSPEALQDLLVDGATPTLRMLIDKAIEASAMRAITGIRFSNRFPND